MLAQNQAVNPSCYSHPLALNMRLACTLRCGNVYARGEKGKDEYKLIKRDFIYVEQNTVS